MIYTTKMCPYCKFKYEHRSELEQKYHIGSPFLRCFNCNKEFVDKDNIEIETIDLKFQRKILIEAIISDLNRTDTTLIERLKFNSTAKKILDNGDLIKSDIICESVLRTMNKEYLDRLQSIGCEYHPLDKKQLFYPKYNMTLADYINNYFDEYGNKKDTTLEFKKGYYL